MLFLELLLIFSFGLAAPAKTLTNSALSAFAFVSYCPSVINQGSFQCGPRCLPFTEVLTRIIDTKHDGKMLIVYNSEYDRIIVSIRGTDNSESLKNLGQDLKVWKSRADWLIKDWAWQTPFNPTKYAALSTPQGVMIHNGFEESYVALRQQFLDAMGQIIRQRPQTQIMLTGHSLGGSIAVLAAVDLHVTFNIGARISVTTFGQPRIGNDAWVSFLNSMPFASRYNRIVRRGDPFAQLIPRNFDYSHSGNHLQIQDDGTVKACNQGENPSCIWPLSENNLKRHSDYFGIGGNCI
jgi:hypothetical protein